MSSPPRFSVVIPAYNAETTIASTVASVLGQTVRDIEVIVVDDGSRDRTADVASAVEDARLRVVSQPNGGCASARNHGARLARGSYIAFLDSDDLWLPRYLERALAALRARPEAGLAYTNAYAFDPSNGRVFARSAMYFTHPPEPPPSDRDAFLLQLLERNFIFTSCTVPARVLADVGGFDERMRLAEDCEMWLRIVLRGYPAAWMPGRNALYRIHPGQKSGDGAGAARTLLTAFAAIDETALPTEAHRHALRARRHALEQHAEALSGGGGLAGAVRRSRPRLGTLRGRLGLRGVYLDTVPPEVAAAYPDLTRV